MPAPSSATPTITKAQLQDPALTVLNQIISFLWTKLSALFAPGTVDLKSTLRVAGLSIPSQTQIPTDTTQAATIATVQSLLAQQAKPLSGLGGTITFATTFTVTGMNGGPFTKMTIQNGVIVSVS